MAVVQCCSTSAAATLLFLLRRGASGSSTSSCVTPIGGGFKHLSYGLGLGLALPFSSYSALPLPKKTRRQPVMASAVELGGIKLSKHDVVKDDDPSNNVPDTIFSKIMQQGFAYLPAGICVSSMGWPVSYEQALAWKVLNDDDTNHCLAFMFMNWSFV